MASTFTALGVQLMTTGEKAGTWGTLTNTNWQMIEQISGGYTTQSIAGGVQTTALVKADGATGATIANRVVEFTGAITGNQIVTIPDATLNWYLLKNSTTDGTDTYSVQFKTVSGTGPTFAGGDRTTKLVYNNGTDVIDVPLGLPGGATTQVQYNNAGAFGGDADLIWTAGTGLTINSQKELRLGDTDDSAYIGQKAAATTTGSYTITWPAAAATSNDQILTSTTGGVLSWVDNSGGTSWQAVTTTGFTAVAGNGYFCDTTSAGFTVSLPAGTLGDEVTCVDYAGTFDSNNLTIAPNGSEKIQGTAASLTVAVERAGLTLAYSGAAQGWLLKDK